MNKIFENINKVLADWNPISVPENIATIEYIGYVPLILKNIGNRQNLVCCLEDILINIIGLDYDPTNKKHSEDLEHVCDKLMKTYQSLREESQDG